MWNSFYRYERHLNRLTWDSGYRYEYERDRMTWDPWFRTLKERGGPGYRLRKYEEMRNSSSWLELYYQNPLGPVLRQRYETLYASKSSSSNSGGGRVALNTISSTTSNIYSKLTEMVTTQYAKASAQPVAPLPAQPSAQPSTQQTTQHAGDDEVIGDKIDYVYYHGVPPPAHPRLTRKTLEVIKLMETIDLLNRSRSSKWEYVKLILFCMFLLLMLWFVFSVPRF